VALWLAVERFRPQVSILIEISWGPRANLTDYLSFTSRSSVDKP
jgi:hypothetical protein